MGRLDLGLPGTGVSGSQGDSGRGTVVSSVALSKLLKVGKSLGWASMHSSVP